MDFKNWLKIAIFLSIALACNQSKKEPIFPKYSETKSGLFYHRYNIGVGKNYPDEGDFLEFQTAFTTLDGKILPFNALKNEAGYDTIHFYKRFLNQSFYEALSLLSEGDSCSFILPTRTLFDSSKFTGLNAAWYKDSLIKMEVKLHRLLTQKQEKAAFVAYQQLCEELLIDEQRLLEVYLDSTTKPFPKKPDSKGLYYYYLKHGNGPRAKSGDVLKIRYIGKFLNGTVFDTSTYEQEALSFRLGEPGQVVKGIEQVLPLLCEGDVIDLLLPSSLAFGSKGSAAGIVSPFKTVTFALEILKIN